MDTRLFHKLLYEAARRLIPREAAVVCAVSGGPDSVALLHGLQRINALRKSGWRLIVAHLDHHLPPGNSVAMVDFTRKQAEQLNLPFFAEAIDVPALARETGESIEEAGRKARYTFLRRAAEKFDARRVAVAHQADDQAETILHRVLRGTSIKGLAGIPEQREIEPGSGILIVRPLLALRRTNVLSYLNRRSIPFMHDATNDDASLATRNFIRNELLPLIRGRMNPSVDAALLRIGRHARHAADFIAATASAAFESAIEHENIDRVELSVDVLSTQPQAVLSEIVVETLRRLGAPMKALSAERIDAVSAALHPAVEFRLVQLAKGLRIERRGRKLCVTRRDGDSACPSAAHSIDATGARS